MRVRIVTTGSRTPSDRRYFACATSGYDAGQVVNGASMISVPKFSRCTCCQAAVAGTRFFVRGDTYVPEASNPP